MRVACVWAIALGACVSLDVSSDSELIVGGAATSQFPSVVFLQASQDGEPVGSCSAVLIDTRVVLTAAHCLDGYSVGELAVYLAPGASSSGPARAVVSGAIHPGADLGALLLEEPVSTTPALLATESLSGRIGDDVRVVGFGRTGTEASDTGTKRAGISTLRRTEFINGTGSALVTGRFSNGSGAQTCFGDSGGGAFVREGGKTVLAGIHSALFSVVSPEADCEDVDTENAAVSVTAYASWIAGLLPSEPNEPTEPEDPAMEPEPSGSGIDPITVPLEPRPHRSTGCAAGTGNPCLVLVALLGLAAFRRRRSR